MGYAEFLCGVMALALVVYLLTGGADFGGGVWDLLASGPRAQRQRHLITHAIGPIWEANHVWVILVVVLLFACFPPAYALISTTLHVPLTLMLVGIVLRGSAFVFRSYGMGDELATRRWGRIFAASSLITPLMMGLMVGALASGRLGAGLVDPHSGLDFVQRYIVPWLSPFTMVTGLLVVGLCMFLAATYLILETDDPGLQEDFRRRALLMVGVLFVVHGLWRLTFEREGMPVPDEGWAQSLLAGLVAGAGVTSLGAGVALYLRRYLWARSLVILTVSGAVLGWVLGQVPYLIPTHLTYVEAAAPEKVLRAVSWTLLIGSPLLLSAFFYLYWVFKGQRGQGEEEGEPG